MEMGLTGRTAIVTGAASGIGRSCARALAVEGARVVFADLDPGGAAEAASEAGETHAALGVDVTDPDSVSALVSHTQRSFGTLDVLVTCAGVFHDTPLDRIAADEWDRILAINLKGTFLCAQAALRPMIAQRRGRIVTIASLAGQTGGLAAGAAYSASKAGVVALTKSIARFAGPHGVTANCVNPGIIDTPMTAGWPREAKERTVTATSLGRMGTAEEVAATVVWLASDAASFVHGAHVDVNGGLLMD
jgi:3-oxoacyl-[acyl-carrier protein] reductase